MPWTSIKGLVLLCIIPGVYFWFRRVGRVMKARQEAVEVAVRQRQTIRTDADTTQAAMFSAVRERSESIYSQAAAMYTQTLEHPLYWLPATILGYRPLSEDGVVPKTQWEEENES